MKAPVASEMNMVCSISMLFSIEFSQGQHGAYPLIQQIERLVGFQSVLGQIFLYFDSCFIVPISSSMAAQAFACRVLQSWKANIDLMSYAL